MHVAKCLGTWGRTASLHGGLHSLLHLHLLLHVVPLPELRLHTDGAHGRGSCLVPVAGLLSLSLPQVLRQPVPTLRSPYWGGGQAGGGAGRSLVVLQERQAGVTTLVLVKLLFKSSLPLGSVFLPFCLVNRISFE